MSIHEENHGRDAAADVSGRNVEDDQAADFVHPVDHGAGTEEEPLEAESGGSYVTGGEHAKTAERVIDEDEKGDYVNPVDHGAGDEELAEEDAGDYTDSDLGNR